MYQETMEQCGAYEKDALWLDVRGNHDTFNTADMKEDFYRKFGIRRESRMYWKSLKYNNVSYGFVAMDATLMPGPKRPFNFFGSMDPSELNQFKTLVSQAEKATDYQFVFGHFPTSTVLAPSPGIKSVIGNAPNALAYLCGHLHTLNGMIPHMYSSQPEGFLELEAGDWKDNRIFRLMAVDQGQLTFKDLVHEPSQKALTVLTNPTDMRYVQPQDFRLIQTSTHIRALVFTNDHVEKVNVVIDDQDEYTLSKVKNHDHLYVSPWNAKKYQDQNVHTAKVVVFFKDGTKTVQEESHFTLSQNDELGTTSIFAKIILRFNWSLVTQAAFGFCASFLVIPLCWMRMDSKRWSNSHWRLIRGLTKVALKNSLMLPITFAAIYVSLGPWAFGYILDDHLGLLFPWGLFIDGHVLPADVTHLYGVFFMFPYLYILTIGLALKRRRKKDENYLVFWLKTNLVFVIVMICQFLHCLEFYLCYGLLATVVGILGVSRIIFVYYLWCNSCSSI